MELFATEVIPQLRDLGEQDDEAKALVTAY
jgi:hypothetical protein